MSNRRAPTDDEQLDLTAVLSRYVTATSEAGAPSARLDALLASCADVPTLLLEVQEARRATGHANLASGLLDSWMRHLADHMDYELYRLRLAAEPALVHLRAMGAPARLVSPLESALEPPMPWAQPPSGSKRQVSGRRAPRSSRKRPRAGAST